MKSVTLDSLAKRGFQIFGELGFAFKNFRLHNQNYLIVYEHNGDVTKYHRASVTPNLELELEIR